MKKFLEMLKRLFKKQKKETPPVVTPPVVTPPVTPPPVVTPPVVTPPVTPPPFVTPPEVIIPIPPPPLPKPGDDISMVYPVIGIGFTPGSTTPYPILGKTMVPVTRQTVRFGPQFPYPKIVQRGGVNINAEEPISEAWKPSMEAWVFGHFNNEDGTPKTFVGEPSNAPKGYPRRSPAGYPLFYAGVAWDAGKNEWTGTPVGPARVQFNGSTHDNDLAVEAYNAAVAARDASIAAWESEFKRTHYLGPIPAQQLTLNDQAWLYIKSEAYRWVGAMVHKNADLHRTILNGYNIDMARCINGGEQHSINNRDVQPDGPLKNELMAAVAAAFAAAEAGTPMEPKFVIDPA